MSAFSIFLERPKSGQQHSACPAPCVPTAKLAVMSSTASGGGGGKITWYYDNDDPLPFLHTANPLNPLRLVEAVLLRTGLEPMTGTVAIPEAMRHVTELARQREEEREALEASAQWRRELAERNNGEAKRRDKRQREARHKVSLALQALWRGRR